MHGFLPHHNQSPLPLQEQGLSLYPRTYKQKDGSEKIIWWVSLPDPTGLKSRVQESTGTSDRDLAETIHNKLKETLNLSKRGFIDLEEQKRKMKPKVKLSDFTKKYLAWSKAHLRPNSTLNAKNALATLKGFYDPKDPYVSEIRPKHVEEWKTWLLETPYQRSPKGSLRYRAKTTQAIYFRTLAAAFTRAITMEATDQNPFTGAEKPQERYSGVPKFFSDDELLAFFTLADEDRPYAQMMRFALNSGLRRRELTFVEPDDLRLGADPPMLWVPVEKTIRWKGKTYHNQTKNAKEREVPMTSGLLELCLELLEERKNNTELSQCPFLFPCRNSPEGLIRWNDDSLYQKTKRIIKRSEARNSLTVHSFRHTFAANLAQQGISRDIVAELLGHSDPKATLIYTPLYPKSYAWAVQRLDFSEETLRSNKKETNHFPPDITQLYQKVIQLEAENARLKAKTA